MTQIRTISPARPDNIVMDWDRLRTEGLQQLEQLATGIWTDFNAHDPGITILEVLCYAITDLGYRTNFDIKDLVASPNKNEHPAKRDLFTPLDILTCLPVTPNDFRRILIDMEGVKNAWFYIAEEGLVADYRSEKEILQDLAAKLKKNERELTGLVDRIKDNYDISESETELVRLILRFYREYNYSFDLDPKDISFKGLYRIVLDLDDAIDTKNVLLVRQIKSAVLDKLHRYRSLCEDFAEVEVVRQKNIALCLEVEILPDVDPHQVEAEILFKIENYLAPEIRFYTLDQLLNEGIPCESIYSGPILDHGFIKESDLEASELRNVIYKSDLYHEIMSIGGVIGITNLKLGKCTNGCPHWEDKWCFTIFDKNEPPAKAVLDPCCTSIFLTIEGIDATTDAQEVQEQLSILQTQNAPLRGDGRDEKLHTPGNYNNWSEFTSIQHDFPEAYHVGDWGLPASATALRQAQVKQLKGFLLFFDQILANYMAQLAKVRDLLSVTQHPNEPTLFFQALEGITGMEDLLPLDEIFILTRKHLRIIKRILKNAHIEERISDGDYNHICKVLPTLVKDTFSSKKEFLNKLGGLNVLEENLGNEIFDVLEPSNLYLQHLADITEPKPIQQLRKNRLLDHLLARFGERFTDYALGLYATNIQQDDAAKDFDDYLQDKCDFLEVTATLQAERGQGYDIRKRTGNTLLPDIWDTPNVSGLEKRVARLLGIPNFQRKSLICKSDFKIEIEESYGPNDRLQYELILLDEKGRVLLKSPKPLRIKKEEMQKHRERLFAAVLNEDNYKIDKTTPKSETEILKINYLKESNKDFFVQSIPAEDAETLKKRILKLAFPGDCNVEGFHLIEHILLRPNDRHDKILNIAPYQKMDALEKADSYSFWITVLLPNWVQRFKNPHFRQQLEYIFRLEAPAHIALRFCWIDNETMIEFERFYKKWLAEKAKCTPDECNVNEFANGIIEMLNNLECTCFHQIGEDTPIDRCK